MALIWNLLLAIGIIGAVAIALEELDDWWARLERKPRKGRRIHPPSQYMPWGQGDQ